MEAANQNDRPAFATRDDLLGFPLEYETLEVNGKPVRVRGLTATEESQIAKLSGDETKKHKLNAIVVRLGTVLADGSAAFADVDEAAILKMPGKVVRQLVDAILKASGLDPKSRAELGKGSAGTGSDASSSG